MVQKHIIAYSKGIKASYLKSAGRDFIFGKMRLTEFPDIKFYSLLLLQKNGNQIGNISSIQKVNFSRRKFILLRTKRE